MEKRKPGTSQVVLGDRSVSRPLPVNFREQDLSLFSHELIREIPATTLRRIRPAVANQSIVFDKGEGSFPFSFTHPWDKKIEALVRDLPKAIRAQSRAKVYWQRGLWITDQWSRNYFHWLTDALPRFMIARESGDESPVVIPERYRSAPHVSSILGLLGEDFCYLSSKSRHVFSELTLVSPVAPTGSPDPQIIKRVAHRLKEALLKEQAGLTDTRGKLDLGPRLWVSRRFSRRRWLSNEDDVVALLESYGFRVLHPELLSVPEQLTLFSRASLVAGMHGAGLANIAMMAPGTSVLEVRLEGDAHNNSYFSLAAACDVFYSYLLASRAAGTGTNGTWRLDLAKLEQALTAFH